MSNTNWESQLSELEKTTFLDYFKKVDADEKGIVLHDEAMNFLEKSNIPEHILKQFWNASDNENKGFLTEQEFCTILKLIACAQHGVLTSDPILSTKVPLPEFNATGVPNNNNNNNYNNSYNNNNNPGYNRPPMPIPQQPTGSSDIIKPEDRQKYIGLFNSFGPENNILSGDRARAAFVQSNLPNNILQTIWNLADTRKTGSLNQTEFIIAMFYIERAMKGQLQFPPTLPANVYASATGRPAASPLVRNNTLQVSSPPPVPRRSPVFKGRTIAPVVISPDEYRKYQTFFNQLDTDHSGFVSGSDAVVFFKHSKLPESDLAQIWDLADTNLTGQLNEQEFAMAMHMINQRVSGGDIPSTLPAFNHIQPSISQQRPPQQQQQNVDLLGLSSDFDESSSTPAPPPPQQQQQQSVDLARSQSTLLQSSITNETNRVQHAHQQFSSESQAVQELLRQIEVQKETLAKKKLEAEEAERQLEAEKKKKEALTQELQIYSQETKHFNSRIEAAQNETKQVRKEIENLETKKNSSSSPPSHGLSPSTSSHNDFFSLSTVTSPSAGNGGLFAKVNEPAKESPSLFAKVNESTSPKSNNVFAKVNESSSLSSPVQSTGGTTKTFDPFAGFKASNSNSAAPSPTISINKLKEDTEQQKRSTTPNSNIDIGEIESKFPDLSTMEQNFAPPAITSPTISVSSAPPGSGSSPHMLFKKTQVTPQVTSTTSAAPEPPKNPSVAKYGFDLSAFESTSNNNSSPFGDNNKSTMKDELSSLFGSPSTSTTQLPPQQQKSSGFDDIFGNNSAQQTTTTKPAADNSFESIFFNK